MITDRDVLNASALRTVGQKADERIDEIREKYGIPDGQQPADELLWLSNISLREMETYGQHVRCKSTYARALAEKRANERGPRSLIELGYLKSRWVAFRYDAAKPAHVAAPVLRDAVSGRHFIVVLDGLGRYIGDDGTEHNATTEGYDVVVQQFLYCFEAVNAAIARLDDMPPPQPVPRWHPEAQKGARPAQETTTSSETSDAQNTQTPGTVQGGTKKPVQEAPIFDKQNTIDGVPSSSHSTQGPAVTARAAPWTPETLIALATGVLAVPDRATIGEESWQRDWQGPAQRLIEKTQDADPAYGWQRVDRHIRGMLFGPTWYATKRQRPAPITLRHVERNWEVVGAELDKAGWQPDETTLYDGPPPIEEVPLQRELPPQPGMSRADAERLKVDIWARYPDIILGLAAATMDAARVLVGIEIGPDQWVDIARPGDFYRPSLKLRWAIAQAVQFAATRTPPGIEVAAMTSESGGGQVVAT